MPASRLIVAVLLVAAAAGLAAAAPVGAVAAEPKVLVVGMDGLNWDRVGPAAAPNLDALVAGGSLARSTLYCPPMAASSSGPGWSTIATGVWPDKHGVRDNGFAGRQYGLYPDFLTRLEQRVPSLHTTSIVSWKALHTFGTFGAAVDERFTYDGDALGYEGQDELVTTDAVRELAEPATDAVFAYLGWTDEQGHAAGPQSPGYRTAIERQDAQLGRMLAAIQARPTVADEQWLVLVTTDHGHTDPGGGHGGCGAAPRGTFVLGRGPGLAPGATLTDTRLTDVAATVLAHMGVPLDPAWGLDGRPLTQRTADPFEAVAPALAARVDETGIPATVLGWTRSTPPGWSIDSSHMGTGGVTEWRGWTFTTDEFWPLSQSDQWRELDVRSRGVIAVADSDEWADRTFTGTFDSTLVSSPYTVVPGGTATISFGSLVRHEAGQTAQLVVRFGSGPDQVVRTYAADVVSQREQLTVPVPAGATSLVVKWRLAGNNNWYWAVDGPQVSSSGTGGPTSGTYTVTNAGTSRLMAVQGASTAVGAGVVQAKAGQATGHRWLLTQGTDGSWTVRAVHSNLCLEVPGHSTAPDAQLVQSTCDGGADQRWQITAAAGGGFAITSAENGLVVAVIDVKSTPVRQRPPSTAATHRWTLSPAP